MDEFESFVPVEETPSPVTPAAPEPPIAPAVPLPAEPEPPIAAVTPVPAEPEPPFAPPAPVPAEPEPPIAIAAPVPAEPELPITPVASAPVEPKLPDAPSPDGFVDNEPKIGKSRKLWYVVGGAALIIVLAAAGWLFFSTRGGDSASVPETSKSAAAPEETSVPVASKPAALSPSPPAPSISPKASQAAKESTTVPVDSEQKNSAITLAELQKMRPLCGTPVLCWGADNALDQKAFDLVTARVEKAAELGSESFYQVTKESYDVDAPFLMKFAERMGILFDGAKLKKKEYATLVKRFRGLKKDDVRAWAQALGGNPGRTVSEPMLAWTLAAFDRLFTEDQYTAERASVYLSRLRGIPKDATEIWTKRLKSFDSPDPTTAYIDAAFAIISLDSFFPENRFDQKVFDAALGGS